MGSSESQVTLPLPLTKQHRQVLQTPTPAKPPTKTAFTYLHPLPDRDLEPPEEEQEEKLREEGRRQIQQIRVRWMSFLKMREGSFLHEYQVRRELGRGGFGCVYKVKGKYTGILRAAKKIKKSQMNAQEYQRLFNEVRILQSLDHPNIAKLYQVYDHEDHYVLIMQLCEGGQLFKRIAKGQLSLQQAARVARQLLQALAYVHSKDIVHRDVKPENILFEKQTGRIKLIDFGIAVQKKKSNEQLTSRIGTAYYIAPEVLCKRYDEKCDVWAAGVVLYMMLLKKPPFNGSNQTEIMEAILTDEVQFQGREWNDLPTDCKELLVLLLKKKPKERPTAFETLQNKWIQAAQNGVAAENLDAALTRMQDFGFRNRLQAVVYTYTVSQLLTSSQKTGLQQIFKKADTDGDGTISPQQFKQIMKGRINQAERLDMMMRLIDLDGSGKIEYTEFVIAALNPKEYLKRQHYQRAFEYFDIDHSGDISYEEVAKFLEGRESQESIRQIFTQIDSNGDGNISKQEFMELFLKQRVKTTMQKMKKTNGMKKTVKDKSIDKGGGKNGRLSNSKHIR